MNLKMFLILHFNVTIKPKVESPFDSQLESETAKDLDEYLTKILCNI